MLAERELKVSTRLRQAKQQQNNQAKTKPKDQPTQNQPKPTQLGFEAKLKTVQPSCSRPKVSAPKPL